MEACEKQVASKTLKGFGNYLSFVRGECILYLAVMQLADSDRYRLSESGALALVKIGHSLSNA